MRREPLISSHGPIRVHEPVPTAQSFCQGSLPTLKRRDLGESVRCRAERHGFEYYRHGTLSLYAALDVKTGKVEGKTAKRHTSAEFIAFLNQLLSKTRWAKEIHIVLDNLSAHKTKAVEEFLAQHPKVRFHFTPTYSSWLNQVELWFAKIQCDVISRGIFTSVADLARKLRRYIEAYAKLAKPFRWTYTDLQKRIRINETPGRITSTDLNPLWSLLAVRTDIL